MPVSSETASQMQDTGCTPDAPADAPQTRQDPDADEKWADMFPVPEGFTLEEYPPLSEEQIVELTRPFRTGKS